MKNPSKLLALGALGLAALSTACGGAAGDANADAKFQASTPSFDHVSIQIDDADATPSSSLIATGGSEQALTTETCHPHLFVRSHEVVEQLNRHADKHLKRIRKLLAHNADLANGATRTWTRIDEDGIGHKFTMTRSATGDSFTFELDLAAKGSTTYVKVFSGEISTTSTTTGTNTVTEKLGAMTFDYTALKSVVPAEKATGQIETTFDIVRDPSKPGPGIKKVLTVKLTAFLPEEGNPHGARTGNFVHVGEPTIGGRLTFQDSLILLCPANPENKFADTTTVARWFKGADGKVHGRSDAKASGGQIATGQSFIGVSCHRGARADRASEDGYWMMKLEDAAGATVQGSSKETTDGAASPCDAALGAVPALANNATDFDFSKPVTFPGEW